MYFFLYNMMRVASISKRQLNLSFHHECQGTPSAFMHLQIVADFAFNGPCHGKPGCVHLGHCTISSLGLSEQFWRHSGFHVYLGPTSISAIPQWLEAAHRETNPNWFSSPSKHEQDRAAFRQFSINFPNER
jgi:hypothetical protein